MVSATQHLEEAFYCFVACACFPGINDEQRQAMCGNGRVTCREEVRAPHRGLQLA